MIFPWQQNEWQQIWRMQHMDHLPHAFLFVGKSGIGKFVFAKHVVQALLCKNKKDTMPCDECHDCRLIKNNSHPNFLCIQPDKKNHDIKIDQVRSVSDFLNQTALKGTYQIVIIEAADYMNMNAANALLKTLEEPPAGCIIILICEQSSRLSATIVSRCHRITFPHPETSQAISWLKQQLSQDIDASLLLRISNDAPLAALSLVNDNILADRKKFYEDLYLLSQNKINPLNVAEKCDTEQFLLLLDFLLSWAMDVIRLQLGVRIKNTDYENEISKISEQTTSKKCSNFIVSLWQIRKEICDGINFNKTLLIEKMLIQWLYLCRENEYVSC